MTETATAPPPAPEAQLVAGAERAAATGSDTYRAVDPRTGHPRGPLFAEAGADDVAEAAAAAMTAFRELSAWPGRRRGALLRVIADLLEEHRESLVTAADAETALGRDRLVGELARTCAQLRAFAALVEDGSYVAAIIDHADPQATPPRPDLRRMMVPVGPVAVFGASNFPFAFSVPGGDTAAALAAGCPVLVKAHPAHPETSHRGGRIIAAAVRAAGAPAGTFSLLHGRTPDVGRALVTAPEIKAVGFTGSTEVGRALFDLAASRPEPIPVFAEMGSINPVFLAPGALAARGGALAGQLAASITLGAGQFCTSPGLLVVPPGPDGEALIERLGAVLADVPAAPMLTAGIRAGLRQRLERTAALPGVEVVTDAEPGHGRHVTPTLLRVDREAFLRTPELLDEHFGPAAVVVTCPAEHFVDVAESLEGNLTATLHATDDEAPGLQRLQSVLVGKAGRVIWNGFPTGVAVTAAQHHGGPYPATTYPAHTSVGVTAIARFLRAVAFQDAPPEVLPPELRDDNPAGLLRVVDGRTTREPQRKERS